MSIHVDLKNAILRAHQAEREVSATRWRSGVPTSMYVFEVGREQARRADPFASLDAPAEVSVFWRVASWPGDAPRYFRVSGGAVYVVESTPAAVVVDGELLMTSPPHPRLAGLVA